MPSVASILAAVEALALPKACLGCEQPLRDGDVCCAACRFAMRRIAPPACSRCGQPLDDWARRSGGQAVGRSAQTCGFCTAWPAELAWARSAVWLDDGPARELVHALKYGGWTCAARPMADLLAKECGAKLRDVDALVSIPLGRTRQRERGHNQAHEIARALGALTNTGVMGDTLVRVRETRTQTEQSRSERWRNVAGAFAPGAATLRGLRIAIVDDVLTTGATLSAAAVALKAAGAEVVGAITFGRAVIPT